MDDNTNPLRTTPSLPPRSGGVVDVDWLAQQIRAVDGNNSLGAGALAEALLPRIRSTLAGPIPEAPADEEVEGVAEAEARVLRDYELGNLTTLGVANHLRRAGFNLRYATEKANALRRSTETDKPGVREAANLVTVNAGLYNQGRADAFEKAAALCDKLAVTAEKTGEQFGAASPARDQHFARKGAFLEIAFAIRALSASPAREEQATHRHKKRGTEYVLIGMGKMQAERWGMNARLDTSDGGYGFVVTDPVDMREVAIYRSATDPTEIWVRPREEFEDGRFEPLPRSTTGGAK